MDEGSGASTVFLTAVTAVELVVCVAVVAVLAPRWHRTRSSATGSALGVFALVAVVLAASTWEPADPGSGWVAVYSDVLVGVLLSIPYLLVRFAWALGGVSDRTHGLLAGTVGLEWVLTAVAPPLPEDEGLQQGWLGLYVGFCLTAWSVQGLVAAAGLWRAGRGQSSVVRHRMRSLGAGAVLLAVTLVLSVLSGEDDAGAPALAVSVVGLLSVLLFALAFLLPPTLRLVWRQADLAALSDAERGLMTALTREDVGTTIVPVLAEVFGGGAALLDEHGAPVRATGLTVVRVAELQATLRAEPPVVDVAEVAPGALAARLSRGWLVVQAGRLAPVFGDDEAVLLGRVATLVDLALQRVALFDQERASRQAAEAAHAELETLLYSVSHDLRSPLISVLGYLDVLQREHGASLGGDGPHFLERISVNAVYMQSLIADLLELSRIGRNEAPPERLDLEVLAEQVVEAARLSSPAADVRVQGPLPVVRLSDVRVRQLLTNLVDNALRHGGRDDLQVTVSCRRGAGGQLQLRVADDGRGIPDQYRARVLRVFERLDAPKSSPGTGMGLAICKRIAETLGGTIAVDGPPPGAASGTTVSITLPADVVVAERLPGQRKASVAATTSTLSEGRP